MLESSFLFKHNKYFFFVLHACVHVYLPSVRISFSVTSPLYFSVRQSLSSLLEATVLVTLRSQQARGVPTPSVMNRSSHRP